MDDGKADTIRGAVVNFCARNGIRLDGRLGGIGSDGAAVMVGRKNGVAVQLKNQVNAAPEISLNIKMLSYQSGQHHVRKDILMAICSLA